MSPLCRDGWARGAEPQLQQKGEKPKRRASSKGAPKRRQPAGSREGTAVSAGSGSNGSSGNGSHGNDGSDGGRGRPAAHSGGKADGDAADGAPAGSEAAVAAAGGSSGDSDTRSADHCSQRRRQNL